MEKDFKIIRAMADFHPDGDVYVKTAKGNFQYVGSLEEDLFGCVPSSFYTKVKKLCKHKKIKR